MKYCLIGERLKLSYSPLIHSLAGVDYKLCEIGAGAFDKFVKNNDFDGFNVTMPFKRSIIPYLDWISDVAKNCNAVNTVLKKDGKLYGYNTDFFGMKYMVERSGVSFKDKNVLISGGGATKDTAKYFALSFGARSVGNVSRTGEINYDNCYDIFPDAQIIINATPVGSLGFEREISVDPRKFKNLEAVFDCVYNPYDTPLLSLAKNCGLKCEHGLDMLVGQALASEEIWLNKKYTQNFVDEILRKVKEKTLNLILIGMPSCGKSTVGALIAEKLGKRFFDTDKIIEENEKNTCAEVFSCKGEAYFREAERRAVESLALVRGAVVATGGGTVESSENVRLLKQNGIFVYLKRRLDLLETDGRVLSKTVGVEQIYKKRRFLYEAAADYEVDNDGDIIDCVSEVIKLYENSCR